MKTTNIITSVIAFFVLVITVLTLGNLNVLVRLFNVSVLQLQKPVQEQQLSGSAETTFLIGNSINASSTVATTSWTKISSADMGLVRRRISNVSPSTIFLIESTTTPTVATTTNNNAGAVGFKLNASGSAGDFYDTLNFVYAGDVYAIASGTPGIITTFIQKK